MIRSRRYITKLGLHEKNKETSNDSHKFLRESLFEILGKQCVRCGFSDSRVLQIDHINGGGLQEIKKYGSSFSMWKFYLNNQQLISTHLQILCPNCNWIKRMENDENRQ